MADDSGHKKHKSSSRGILKLDPKHVIRLEVKRGREPISFTGDLHISNPSRSSALAYKVKTTEPDRYFVRPNQGVIATDTVARVRIHVIDEQAKYVAEEIRDKARAGEAYKCPDRFLVQSHVLTAEDLRSVGPVGSKESAAQLQMLWDSAHERGLKFYNERLKVSYPTAEELDADPDAAQDAPEADPTPVPREYGDAGAAPVPDGAHETPAVTGGESKPTGPAAAADGGGQVAPRPSEGGGGGAGDAGAGGSALDEHRSGAPLDTNPPPSISSQDTQAKAALVSEMKDLRAKYQELLNYTISLDADMKRAQAGEDAKARELQAAKRKVAELTEELTTARGSGAARRRKGGDGDDKGAAGKDGAGGAPPPAGVADTEGGAFALWHVILVGLVMFLIGRLVTS